MRYGHDMFGIDKRKLYNLQHHHSLLIINFFKHQNSSHFPYNFRQPSYPLNPPIKKKIP
ncbi:hypothetical protein HanXRQr2_Chr16g0730051 [Helianthus annuus]|uniref:Uncharacterized protein n=1 Tax=Helianthus annuus TaxID=4232 RepID=A0A9K3DMX4_HELAN|nr:hypothetical protein HanXRQr2_Chr16g0730051 [Helianthus annuus]